MLSDDALEKLMLPILRRQENLNNYIIGIIANRIRRFGTVNASDLARLKNMMYIGGDMIKIENEIARVTKLNTNDIRDILYTAAEDLYGDSKDFFEYRCMSFIPIQENAPVMTLVKAISNETAETYINLSNTRSFVIRDLWGNKGYLPIRDTYINIIDEAVQSVKANLEDYQSAIRRSMSRLIDSGVRQFGYDPQTGRTFVNYESDYTRRLDSAVRQNILDGVKAINQQLQDEVGKQFGSDGKELSVHAFPAPDHAPVQGHVFYNAEYDKLQNGEDFEDVDGNSFIGFERSIGMWNCKHFAFSIIVGVHPRNYTQEQLDAILANNEKGYIYNGRHFTGYQCTQMQRKYETEIRKAKDGYIAAETVGDNVLKDKYHSRVMQYMNEYKAFSKGCGLRMKYDKIYVAGYKP